MKSQIFHILTYFWPYSAIPVWKLITHRCAANRVQKLTTNLGKQMAKIWTKMHKSGSFTHLIVAPYILVRRTSQIFLIRPKVPHSDISVPALSNLASKVGQIGLKMGQIWDFLRSVSVHNEISACYIHVHRTPAPT